jgi:hypothetical protein
LILFDNASPVSRESMFFDQYLLDSLRIGVERKGCNFRSFHGSNSAARVLNQA